MQILFAILAVVAIGLLIWWQVKFYRANPQAYSKENTSKSAGTLGLLALVLIAFVAVLVMLVRA